MSIFSEVRARGKSSFSPRNPYFWWLDYMGTESATSKVIDADTALTISTVYACVKIIAQSISSLPFKVYRRLAEGKEAATDYFLWNLIHDFPNDDTTAIEFWENTIGHAVLRGNSYAQIVREPDIPEGRIKSLWILNPDRMQVKREKGTLKYEYITSEGESREFDAWDILHIRGLSSNGITGLSPISISREAFGLSLAAEEYEARFLKHGLRPSGIFSHPGQISDEARKNLEESLEKDKAGYEKAGKVMLLEEGVTWTETGMSNEDAQFLLLRKFQVAEVARMFGVPLFLVQETEKSTSWGTGIEQMTIGFVTYTLRSWATRVQSAVHRDLFPVTDRKEYFAEFLFDDLLRGDAESRAKSMQTQWQIGSLTPNEIRAIENRNPLPGGDTLYIPLNFIPAGMAGQVEEKTERSELHSEGPEEVRDSQARIMRLRTRQAHLRLFWDAFERVLRRELADLRKGTAKHIDDFGSFVDELYGKLRKFTRDAITPIVMHYAGSMQSVAVLEIGGEDVLTPELEEQARAVAGAVAREYGFSSSKELMELFEGTAEEELEKELNNKYDHWEETKADKWANRETVETGEAMIRASYIAAGIVTLRWVAIGKSCKWCQQMNGRKVGVTGSFVGKGGSLDVGGDIMTLHTTVRHPPLHGGCDCIIRPGV